MKKISFQHTKIKKIEWIQNGVSISLSQSYFLIKINLYWSQTRQPGSGEWKHGLFECACPDCACAYCFMPCYAYQIAKAAGKEGFMACAHCCFPVLLCCLRCEIRENHGIQV